MIASFGDKTPEISPDTWVATNATVVGDVKVGAECGIWFGAVIRADCASISIGEQTNVQDNCVLHVDPGSPMHVGGRVSIGHGAVLHGCSIGDDVLVGMGATVLNGARVGAGSLIAAGALVLAGADIPPGSLVAGVPGKVRRPLSEEEMETTRENGRDYVDLARRYAAAGVGVV